VARWKQLVDNFTGGNPDITEGVQKAWADRANWPGQLQRLSEPYSDRRVWAFIGQAAAARK
jgi:hypothetical protein